MSPPSLESLLAAGKVDEFNAQRGQRRRVEMFAADLGGVKIPGVDLSGAWLEKSDLTGADLTDANLTKTDLSGVDASEATLCDAIAVGAKLKEAFLDGADLSGADLSHSDLAEAVMTNTKGDSIRLTGARLRETDATGSSWPSADLVEARLHKANLTNVDLTGADLTEAIANEANFTGAILDGIIGLRAKLQEAKLVGASLIGARLEEANLEKADLTNANLERADLRKANLTGAILTGARLRGANLSDAVLEGVDLSGLDVEDVDLRGVDPRLLGLSAEQLGRLAAVGAAASADAPMRFAEVSVARNGTASAVLWENHDTDETLSLRWAWFGADNEPVYGVLPLSADGVLSRAVVPYGDGFLLLAMQERPGGPALVSYPVSADGTLGASKVEPLGYEPGVRPSVRAEGGAAWIWGLALRGPTVVVQKLAAGEAGPALQTVASGKVATAKGFLGGSHPVLWCKGGVVIPCGPNGPSAPLRTPETFPGRMAVAVTQDDGRVLVAWSEEHRNDQEPGGLRFAWLGPGIVPRTQVLTVGGEVGSLDARPSPGGASIAWIDENGRAFVCAVPDGEPVALDPGTDHEFDEIRFFLDDAGPAGPVQLGLVTIEEQLLVVAADGHPIALLGE
jgi:uncharacterized protein YjbI with pentapeptide repeats